MRREELDALLSDGGPKDVANERLASFAIVSASAGGGVEGAAKLGGAERRGVCDAERTA
jgi:hypothetical protein